MTEKIARRGIYTPDAYEPDVLRRITVAEVMDKDHKMMDQVYDLIEHRKKNLPVLKENDPLSKAVELLALSGKEPLPVIALGQSDQVIGLLTYKDVLHAYKLHHQQNEQAGVNLSLKRGRIKMMIKSRKILNKTKTQFHS
ncbi:hypothetical protein D3C87_1638600 [compost metagenome]